MNQCLNALLICFVIIKNSTEGLLSSRLIKKTKYTLKIKQNHNEAKVIIQAAEAWSSWRSLQGKEATRRGRVWVARQEEDLSNGGKAEEGRMSKTISARDLC